MLTRQLSASYLYVEIVSGPFFCSSVATRLISNLIFVFIDVSYREGFFKAILYANICVPIFQQFAMDQFQALIEPGRQFARDSIRLVKRCTKPDRKEYQKIAVATAIGFAIMGFIGFFVKLIHIPINNIIVGA
ncbi:hypothetical protein Y032_0368g63 [Ancylostoma ceylanicum]|uniref:Protein translocase SEC61 complex gamma subunit, and eukaryotic n=1 Tax=Ancylostoma ceylanicum TaxID=53326 RepID=A0A016RUU1_9BILA|nr:hypothetical protein Y032_0368g63 [Ancylostoma ceylanicum]